MTNLNSFLLNDRAIAATLCMSQSWVRKQRWLRRKGEPHTLDIEPIFIGTTPRYKHEDVENWLQNCFQPSSIQPTIH